MSIKSGPKLISLENEKNDTSLTNCLKWGNFGKIIVTTGLEKLPKVQLIVQSGHIDGKRERERNWNIKAKNYKTAKTWQIFEPLPTYLPT